MSVEYRWSWWGDSCGPRPVFWLNLVKHKRLSQEQAGSVAVASMAAWKYQSLKHIAEEKLHILSVWYLKQTICILISVRIREGGFSLARFIFFGKEWQAKIRLDPENFKGSIRNRQQIFLCDFLPKRSLQSFLLGHLGPVQSFTMCFSPFFSFGCSVLWHHFCRVTKYESPVISPVPILSSFLFCPSLIMYLSHTSLLGELQAVFLSGSLFAPLWDETGFAKVWPRNWLWRCWLLHTALPWIQLWCI